jgi:hypothetical protein
VGRENAKKEMRIVCPVRLAEFMVFLPSSVLILLHQPLTEPAGSDFSVYRCARLPGGARKGLGGVARQYGSTSFFSA